MGKKVVDWAEESIMVKIIDLQRDKTYRQSLKRKNLIDMKVWFTAENGERVVGQIVAFNENGDAAIIQKDGLAPRKDADILVIKE